ncbi:MAG TPA: DegT/DnrJ/EryC1/StrS family aminotransferase [Myxococcaceae bacterium]|nr:DegT/DnrJ/EryC1/StrS family aminotransferase [Myxococcaceae bacterium]
MPRPRPAASSAPRVSMGEPSIEPVDVRAVAEVVRSGQLALGARSAAFERTLAEYVGARHAIAVSSGTAGLHLAAIAAGIRPGDEVVTTPFSFIASTNCFIYEGARPVFADIDPDTLMPDAASLSAALTPRTRAILMVHVFGDPADADAYRSVADRHGIALLEDACEALGSEYKGRRAGTLGDVGVFGFYPNKQITTGEGGMIVTYRKDWDALFRSLRNQGRDVHAAWLTHARVGFNYRLDEMSAALGLSQLGRIDRLITARERVARAYTQRLSRISGVEPPRPIATTTRMSRFAYVIRLEKGLRRDVVMRGLEERGIPTRAYFSPLHLQPAYRERFGFKKGQFPVTEDVAERCVALPFHARMNAQQVEAVCGALEEVIASRGARRTTRPARPVASGRPRGQRAAASGRR